MHNMKKKITFHFEEHEKENKKYKTPKIRVGFCLFSTYCSTLSQDETPGSSQCDIYGSFEQSEKHFAAEYPSCQDEHHEQRSQASTQQQLPDRQRPWTCSIGCLVTACLEHLQV